MGRGMLMQKWSIKHGSNTVWNGIPALDNCGQRKYESEINICASRLNFIVEIYFSSVLPSIHPFFQTSFPCSSFLIHFYLFCFSFLQFFGWFAPPCFPSLSLFFLVSILPFSISLALLSIFKSLFLSSCASHLTDLVLPSVLSLYPHPILFFPCFPCLTSVPSAVLSSVIVSFLLLLLQYKKLVINSNC